MMVVVFKYLTRFHIQGITLYPFVFIANSTLSNNVVLINHERIHLRQQLELLIVPFYIWYAIEFIIKRIKYKSWYLAYKNISFEREAYKNDNNLNYLKSRLLYSFFNYLWLHKI